MYDFSAPVCLYWARLSTNSTNSPTHHLPLTTSTCQPGTSAPARRSPADPARGDDVAALRDGARFVEAISRAALAGEPQSLDTISRSAELYFQRLSDLTRDVFRRSACSTRWLTAPMQISSSDRV